MISLNSYIFESREISTTSNKQRRKELEKWLKHKNYTDYVETLNKMLEDPKSAALLEDGFGGDLGDTQLKFSVQKIPVSQLMPTQKEIDFIISKNTTVDSATIAKHLGRTELAVKRKIEKTEYHENTDEWRYSW